MTDIKSITHNPRNPTRILHVETQGCIVNIQPGLHDASGHPVTAIEILCDRYSGESWYLPDLPPDPLQPDKPRQTLNLRVMPYTPPLQPVLKPESAPDDDEMKIMIEAYFGFLHGRWETERKTVSLPAATPEDQIGQKALEVGWPQKALDRLSGADELSALAFWGVYHWEYADEDESEWEDEDGE